MNTTKNTEKIQICKGAIHSSIVFNNKKSWMENYGKVCGGDYVELVIPTAYMFWNNQNDYLELVLKSKNSKSTFELILNGEVIKKAVRFATIENFLYKKWADPLYGVLIMPGCDNMYESVTQALVETHKINQEQGLSSEENVNPYRLNKENNTQVLEVIEPKHHPLTGEEGTEARYNQFSNDNLDKLNSKELRDSFIKWREEEDELAITLTSDFPCFVFVGVSQDRPNHLKYKYRSLHTPQDLFSNYYTCSLIQEKLDTCGYITLPELIHFYINFILPHNSLEQPEERDIFTEIELTENRKINEKMVLLYDEAVRLETNIVKYFDESKNNDMSVLNCDDFSLKGKSNWRNCTRRNLDANYNTDENKDLSYHKQSINKSTYDHWENSLQGKKQTYIHCMAGCGLFDFGDVNEYLNSEIKRDNRIGEILSRCIVLYKILKADLKDINEEIDRRNNMDNSPETLHLRTVKKTQKIFNKLQSELGDFSTDWIKTAPRVLDAGWCAVVVTCKGLAEFLKNDCDCRLEHDKSQGGWIMWSDSTNDSFTKFHNEISLKLPSLIPDDWSGKITIVSRQL